METHASTYRAGLSVRTQVENKDVQEVAGERVDRRVSDDSQLHRLVYMVNPIDPSRGGRTERTIHACIN
jgi:hypothetical protein